MPWRFEADVDLSGPDIERSADENSVMTRWNMTSSRSGSCTSRHAWASSVCGSRVRAATRSDVSRLEQSVAVGIAQTA